MSPGVDSEEATYRFAGAFLMPEKVLWAKIGKRRSDIDWREFLALKLSFGMSIQAITHRAGTWGIISQALSQQAVCHLRQGRVAAAAVQGAAGHTGQPDRALRAAVPAGVCRGRYF